MPRISAEGGASHATSAGVTVFESNTQLVCADGVARDVSELGIATTAGVASSIATQAAADTATYAPLSRQVRQAASITDRATSNIYGLAGTGTTGRTTRTYYVATADCSDLVCWWEGTYGNEAVALAQPYSIKAAVEVMASGPSTNSGTVYPLTFGGAASITINPGQIVKSDPLPIDLVKGQGFYVRVYASVGNSAYPVLLGRQHNAALFEASVLSSDLAYSTGTWTGSASYTCGPVRIEGSVPARHATLAVVGSSTFEGIGDVQDTSSPGGGTYGWGWARRLCNGNVGLVHTAKASELAAGFVPAAYLGRGPLWTGCEWAIEGYGANDINNGNSLATVQADKLRIWTALARRGARVYTPTLHPTLTTSTDSFATTVNQTPAATNSVRTALNAWIRAGAPINASTKAAVAIGTSGALLAGSVGHPLTGWLEIADTIETARDSGIYKVGYTVDGQHLTSTAAIAAVAALTNPFV